jgi:MoaA/NifB/PqqE/SkfB family radical SAM enzyme
MVAILRVRTSCLSAVGNGTVSFQGDTAVVITPPEQDADGAEAAFPVPGIECRSRIIKVRVRVARGTLGVGWQSKWELLFPFTVLAISGPAKATELAVVVAAGRTPGKLVFRNRTWGDKPAIAQVEEITVIDYEEAVLPFYRAGLEAEERGDKDAAIAHYKLALAEDPAHVESIAGLGRVRLIRPPQPFKDEVKRRVSHGMTDVVIAVRNPCNYRCFYCVAAGENNTRVERFDLEAIERAYARIRGRVVVTAFDCGGGEPTVHPQFPELLRIASRFGAVSFPSNNSQNPERWLPRETAKRILIRAALHPESEPRVERYLQYARYLIDAGCEFQSIFIAHPTRIAKIPEYREAFAGYGIPFTPVSFIGEYEGRAYPHSYTDQEKELLGLEEEARYWMHRVEPHVTRIRDFRGIPCLAGQRSIYLQPDGSIRRCVYDSKIFDAPLKQPDPCGVGTCGCGLLLKELNSLDGVEGENYWGAKLGLDPIPTQWMELLAEGLGYANTQDALAAEATQMYDALMAAYGKDERPYHVIEAQPWASDL